MTHGETSTRDALPILQALMIPAVQAQPRRLADALTQLDLRELWREIREGAA